MTYAVIEHNRITGSKHEVKTYTDGEKACKAAELWATELGTAGSEYHTVYVRNLNTGELVDSYYSNWYC